METDRVKKAEERKKALADRKRKEREKKIAKEQE